MRQLDAARAALSGLVKRLRADRLDESGPEPGFTPLIDVMGDVGRALAAGDADDLRSLLPVVAALREALESEYSPEAISRSPYDALRNAKATPYAAGALWASSALVYAALEQRDAEEERAAARRERRPVHELVREILQRQGHVRPGDIKEALDKDGRRIDKSVISRCLGDLLDEGLIAPMESPPSGDRRHRYYRLVDSDAVQDALRDRAAQLARDMLSWHDPDEAKRFVCMMVDREANTASREPTGRVAQAG